MRFAVIGVGGIGGFFGGKLAAAGHDVAFVARGANLEALRRDGLAVTSVHGDFTVAPVQATDDPASVGPVDAVLLATKTWQFDGALATVKPLLGEHTAVITTQNGVEAPHQVAEVFGRSAVLPGIAKVIAMLAEPGHVRHLGGPGSLDFAEWDNEPTDRVAAIRAALSAAGIVTPTPADIWAALWAKFLVIVPFGGLGAVADAGFGALRERPGTRRLLEAGMAEIEQLAVASGISLPSDILATSMAFIDQQPANGTSSLHRDIKAGRPSELEAWTGSVVRLGERLGVPTPVNSYCYEILALRQEISRSGG
jgi:2-dehydropantoate 2-reductase